MKLNKTGFTLTELMTVVIILAILMGIAAGSYRKAAERSHFAEGLAAAHALMGAAERYYQDHSPAACSTLRPKIADLDISLAHQKAVSGSDYAVKSKYFQITLNSATLAHDTTKCVVGTGTAVRTGGGYTMTVYPEAYGPNRFAADTCTGQNQKTEFCVSMGYTNCNSSGVCKKD